jgi:hypothetical protein
LYSRLLLLQCFLFILFFIEFDWFKIFQESLSSNGRIELPAFFHRIDCTCTCQNATTRRCIFQQHHYQWWNQNPRSYHLSH